MPDMIKATLLATFAGLGLLLAFAWLRAVRSAGAGIRPSPIQLAIGFLTDFLDTLGIGSFATTTTALRATRAIDDRLIPGTLNVGHALPTIAQALIYVTIVKVEMTTLVVMIAASVLGGYLGSGVVARLSRRRVQIAMGVALAVAASIMSCSALGLLPAGGVALGLPAALLVVGALGNFALGALMTAGIGLYGPCMILVSMLGMDPRAAFPIMMGSCASLMPAASARFIAERAVDHRAALGLTLGGIPGVLIAAWLVKSLPLDAVRWLVIVAAAYTAATLLHAARNAAPEPAATR
jgi:uncharacterized membrane protein YfcA